MYTTKKSETGDTEKCKENSKGKITGRHDLKPIKEDGRSNLREIDIESSKINIISLNNKDLQTKPEKDLDLVYNIKE